MNVSKVVLRPNRQNADGIELPLKWADVRDFLNTATEEQLQGPVWWWGDEKGGGMHAISEACDDLVNPSGDGLECKSVYDDDPDFDVHDEPIVLVKGSLVFEID